MSRTARHTAMLFAAVLVVVGRLAVAASDGAGPLTFHATSNGATDDLDVLVDLAPPTLEILTPVTGSVIGGTTVTVTGTVVDYAGLSENTPGNAPRTLSWVLIDRSIGVGVADGNAPVIDGHFAIPDLPTLFGQNELVIRASDANGRTNTNSTVFTVDPNAPVATLTSFHDGETTLLQAVPVDLDFAAPTTLVSVNGVPDGRSFPAGLASGVLDLPLVFGPNSFELELATDAGTSMLAFTFFRAESNEPIAITSPPESFINTTSVPVTVTTPLGTPFVTVNGVDAVRGADLQTFTAQVPLVEGTNKLTALAYPFGQRAVQTVVRDTTPPRVIAMVPADGLLLLNETVTFQGVVSEQAQLSLASEFDELDGHTIPILAPVQPFPTFTPLKLDTFEFDDFPLGLGENDIVLTLVDRAGNETDVPITLMRTDKPLTILAPEVGSSVDSFTTSLQLQAVEALGIDAVYVNGTLLPSLRQNIPAGFTEFDGLPLKTGPNDIRIVYNRFGFPKQTLTTTVTSTAVVTPVNPITSLQGLVTDSVTGAPLAGATITVSPLSSDDLVVTTGSDGRYRVVIPPGPYTVVIRHEGFIPASGPDVALLGETIETDQAMLRWSTGILPATLTGSGVGSDHLEGTVTAAATSQPLAGAQVRVTAGSATFDTVSAADGSFVFNGLPVGPFAVAVTKTGFFPASYAIDNTEAVDVRLTPALKTAPTDVTVAALVQNPSNRLPQPNVRATLLGPNTQAFSDVQGQFQFTHVPIGHNALRLEEPGFTDAVVIFDANPKADGSPTQLAISYPTNSGSGRFIAVSAGSTAYVRDRFTGRGIVGAQVSADGNTAVTDANGAFLVPPLSEGDSHFLLATAPSYEPETLRIVVAPGATDPLAFDLLSHAPGSIAGVVQDAVTHRGIAGASIKIAGSLDQMVGTSSDGSFVLDAVSPGTYALEVTQPQYLAGTVASVIVNSGATAPASVSLVHRPVVGGIAGRVLDAQTSAPIAGATITGPGSSSATSDAQGNYALAALPAGMTTLSITAAGYPVTARDVAVKADVDATTPTTTPVDLSLSATSASVPDAPIAIHLAQGGQVRDPSGRLTLVLPRLGLTQDALVTVRMSADPVVASGQLLPIDPALNATGIRAVGAEMEIVLKPLVPGGPVPRPVAPWFLVERYTASEAASAGAMESHLVPFVWNGSQFTALDPLPYLHAVDEVDRIVVEAVNPSTTETGAPLFSLAGKSRPLYAASIEPQPTADEFDITVQLGAPPLPVDPVTPFAPVLLHDLAHEGVLGNEDFPDAEPHPNASPVVFIHGWDPENLYHDSELLADPFDDPNGDERYASIIRDVAHATAGVYRPIWTSYNPRNLARSTASTMFTVVKNNLAGIIRGIPSDPTDPNSGRFENFDTVGFSKGGLIARSLLCLPDVGLLGAVEIATPHHGGLNRLDSMLEVDVLNPFGIPGVPGETLREVIQNNSPGTADLLDYTDGVDPEASGNPYLADLNQRPCSASADKMALIAGTDSVQYDAPLIIPPPEAFLVGMETEGLVPIGLPPSPPTTVLVPFFNVGAFLAKNPSDGVVPLWSAQGNDEAGFRLPAFVEGIDSDSLHVADPQPFNHFHGGSAQHNQAFGPIVAKDILPTLSEWITTTEVEEPRNQSDPATPGSFIYTAPTRIEWASPGAAITGFAQVLYALDTRGNWHLVGGANASGKIDQNGISTGERPVSVSVAPSEKTIDTPIPYSLPELFDSAGQPIHFSSIRTVLTVPLPYNDPDDNLDENVVPIDHLPKTTFQTAPVPPISAP